MKFKQKLGLFSNGIFLSVTKIEFIGKISGFGFKISIL